MRKIVYIFMIFGLGLVLSACTFRSSLETKYQKSKMIKPMTITGASSSQISEYYRIPHIYSKAPEGKPSLMPPGAKMIPEKGSS